MMLTAKTRFDLVPFASVGEIADVLAHGADKYTNNNWCRGTNWGRYFSALCRHVFAWWRGEDKDPETGFSHLAHAGCCLIFLMEYQRNNWGTDDRFKGPDGSTFTKFDGADAIDYDFSPQFYFGSNYQNSLSPDVITFGDEVISNPSPNPTQLS